MTSINFKHIVILLLISATGCAGNENEYAAYHPGVEEPYVLIDGCKFWIHTDSGSSAVSAPKVDNDSQTTVTYSVSIGEYTIRAHNCEIVENASSLPVYTK